MLKVRKMIDLKCNMICNVRQDKRSDGYKEMCVDDTCIMD